MAEKRRKLAHPAHNIFSYFFLLCTVVVVPKVAGAQVEIAGLPTNLPNEGSQDCLQLLLDPIERLGLVGVKIPSNWVPTIRTTFSTQKTSEEVLGQPQILPLMHHKVAIFNPSSIELNDGFLYELDRVLTENKTSLDSGPYNLAPALYRMYQQLFPPGSRTAVQISVLSQPVTRKNWWSTSTKSDHQIMFTADWSRASSWGLNYVFYLTDGINHYSVDANSRTTGVHSETSQQKIVAEILAAASLGELQRMLSARYGLADYSSQGTFQMPKELLSKILTEDDWTTLRKSLQPENP